MPGHQTREERRRQRKQIEQIRRLQTENPFQDDKILALQEAMKIMQESLQDLNRREEELQRRMEDRNASKQQLELQKIEQDYLHRQQRDLSKQIENRRALVQILHNLQLRVPSLNDNLPDERKQQIREQICALDDARTANKNTEEKLELRKETSRRIYELERSLAEDHPAERQKRQKEKELRKLRSDEFASLEAERKQQEKEDRNKEQESFTAFLNRNNQINALDHSVVEDKHLLGMMNSQLQEELFGAENAPDSKAVVSRVKAAEGAELQLQEDDKEELRDIMEAVYVYNHIYVTGHENDHEKTSFYQNELILASYAYRHLNALVDRMNRRNEEANHAAGEDKVYTDDKCLFAAVNLLNYFDAHRNGYLGMLPEEPEDPQAEHYDFRGNLDSPKLEQNVMRSYAHKTAKGSENRKLSEMPLEADHTNNPLFPHEPCAQDVTQGGLGDCYFVSTLAEIAQTHPDRIREMMRDNHDGTATVRFYQKKGKQYVPFYVTVEKVMKVGQTRNCEWAEILERALAVSGICVSKKNTRMVDGEMEDARPVPHNINDIYKKIQNGQIRGDKHTYPWLYDEHGNLQTWKPSLDQITGSNALFAFPLLLGPHAEVEYNTLNSEADQYWQETDPNEQRRISLTSRYTSGEIRAYEHLRKLKAENMDVVTATGTANTDHKQIDGLNHKHAYSVIGVREKSYEVDGRTVTRKFVVLRNPHSNVGRKYELDADGHHLIPMEDAKRTDGICEVELKDYCKQFSNFIEAVGKPPLQERNRSIAIEEKKVLASYAEAMKEVSTWLESKIPFRLNSGEYRALRSAVKDMNTPAKSYDDLQTKLNRLEQKLVAYKMHVGIEIENTEWKRPEKMQAVHVLEDILHASARGYMAPKEYLMKKTAKQLLENLQTLNPADQPEGYAKAKQIAEEDPKRALENLLQSELLHKWVSGKSVMEMKLNSTNQKRNVWEQVCTAVIHTKQERNMTMLSDKFTEDTFNKAVAEEKQKLVK